MVSLYIKNQLVDIKDDISILFTKQKTDYTNPTIVKNSFTKTVTLPGTNANNKIFSNLWKLDLDVRSFGFNSSIRNPFVLIKDGNLVDMGYVKLNNINWDGYGYSYDVTLYGEMGNILYRLSYTDDDEKMTLGDLDMGISSFFITKEIISSAWDRLGGNTSAPEQFDTLNFMVSYDGIPQAKNFDPKKCWCSVNRNCPVYWQDGYHYITGFPASYTDDDGIVYTYISSMLSRVDPDDHYGLMELKKDVTPLEMRDLRSYLLRPVIKISKIFDAISDYMDEKLGYTLDLSDSFFQSSNYTDSWMTLSMLYELDDEVHSGSLITKDILFKNTSSPASYLISFCKIYGLYIDVDYVSKKLIITRLPNFYQYNGHGSIRQMEIDLSKEVKITPLSFDKATYTFDYGDGDGEFIKKYKDSYGFNYGSKKVNTGYKFDASSEKYIDNNVFRGGADVLLQSAYFRYPYTNVTNPSAGDVFLQIPSPLLEDADRPNYKLFNVGTDATTDIGGEMVLLSQGWYGPGQMIAYKLGDFGYQGISKDWVGLRYGILQDGFPKLDFQSSDKKGTDGKDVLVKFNGFQQLQYFKYKNGFQRESDTDHQYVKYLLSDDSDALNIFLGKNCYYDNPNPAEGYGSYIDVIDSIPSFTRSMYDYTPDTGTIPASYVSDFQDVTGDIGAVGGIVFEYHSDFLLTSVVDSAAGRKYAYFDVTGKIKDNHRYFIGALIKTSASSAIKQDNDYDYADLVGSTLIDANHLYLTDQMQVIGSIVDSGSNGHSISQLAPLSTEGQATWEMRGCIVYDLTEMGIDDMFSYAQQYINYFDLTIQRFGYVFNITDTLEFSIPQEIYVPATTVNAGIGIYNRYWARYIADMYDINTRIIECYVRLENTIDVFRKFYSYDNCIWVLCKIVDWSMETKMCKATFMKVNDLNSYITDDSSF